MKTLKLLSISFILFSFLTSCSSDDDNNSQDLTVKQMLMSGKWYLEKTNGVEVHPCRKSTFMHFYDDNKFTYAFYQESMDGTDCYLEYIQHGTFVLVGDIVVEVDFTDSNFDGYYEIISITPNQLVIRESDLTFTFDKTEG